VSGWIVMVWPTKREWTGRYYFLFLALRGKEHKQANVALLVGNTIKIHPLTWVVFTL